MRSSKESIEHKKCDAGTQTEIQVQILNEENREENKKDIKKLLGEAINHRKGIPYTDDAKAIFSSIHIIRPKCIDFLYAMNMAPHPTTVIKWVTKQGKPLIHNLENPDKILELIHNYYHNYLKDRNKPILANIAGDGIYLSEKGIGKNRKKLQHYVIQLQPLERGIPCLAINIASIGKKESACELTQSDIKNRFKKIIDIINKDEKKAFSIIYKSTDADQSTDAWHQTFFENVLIKGKLLENIDVAAKNLDFRYVIPISDMLHILKSGRAHLINHALKLRVEREILNIDRIKAILGIGPALDDLNHWAKMSDAYAIALFQFKSFIKLIDSIAGDEALYLAPFTFLNEAIRSTELSIQDRIMLLQCATNIFLWNYMNVITNKDTKWKAEFSSTCEGTLFGTPIFLMRCINLCFGIAVALRRMPNCPLDRIGTHVLENYFGFIRVASLNDHSPERMKIHASRSIVLQQCLENLKISIKHNMRENTGGTQIKNEMVIENKFQNITAKELSDALINNSVEYKSNIKDAFKNYENVITESKTYQKIYYHGDFAAKQPSVRIIGFSSKKSVFKKEAPDYYYYCTRRVDVDDDDKPVKQGYNLPKELVAKAPKYILEKYAYN